MSDEEALQALGVQQDQLDNYDADVTVALEDEAASQDGFTHDLAARLTEVIRLLEPLDLEAAVQAIEEEPLPVEDRRAAALNRADRAELVRAFLALQQAGRSIVRRLEGDAEGKVRDE